MITAQDATAKAHATLKALDTARACCQQLVNLHTTQEKPELFVTVCAVCGARHRRLMVETARLSATLTER